MPYGQNHAASGGGVTPSIDDLLTEAEAAAVVDLTVGTLQTYRKMRTSGERPEAGPEFLKRGYAVFYTRAALDAFASRRRGA
ncbi:hypothetical protein [Albidovulum sp.]|uniref:hypothetical protein n=1 Tax=Albidovulum sp. TaxID=1872424 RepID=UPI0039B980FA